MVVVGLDIVRRYAYLVLSIVGHALGQIIGMRRLEHSHLRNIIRNSVLLPNIVKARVFPPVVSIERAGAIFTIQALESSWKAELGDVLRAAHVEEAGVEEQSIDFTLGVLGRHQVARTEPVELLFLVVKLPFRPLIDRQAGVPLFEMVGVQLLYEFGVR